MAKNVVRLGAPVLADGIEVSCSGRGVLSALMAFLLVASPLVMMPQEANAATILANDSFGSSSVGTVPGWTDSDGGGSNASVTNTAPNRAGSATAHHAKLRQGAHITKTVDTTGYEDIILNFYWNGDADGDGASDNFVVEWKPTSSGSYTVLATYRLDSQTTWSSLIQLPLPAGADNTSVDIRFRGDTNQSAEEALLDDVSVEGTVLVVDPGDVTAPVLSEVTPVTTPTSDDTPSYTFNSDEEGTITYGGSCSGSTTNAVAGDNIIDLDVADGLRNDCTITVTDLSANANVSLPLAISPFTVDSTGPTATVTSSIVGATSISPIEFTIQFSEEVADFSDVEGDVSVTNATLDSFTADSATVYRVSVSPITDGDVTVSVAGGVAHDALGNGNTSGSYTVEYDTTGPGVEIVSPLTGSFTDDSTPLIDFTYTGDTFAAECEFDGDDFDCLGTNDFVPVDPVDDGEHTFSITVQDELGNEASAEVTFTVDTTAPEVEISSSATNPTNVAPIAITVEFNETVTGFEEGDVTVTNGTIDDGSFGGTGDTYGFNITPDGEGEVLVDIGAGAADDTTGNDSEVADQFSITYDSIAPTLTIDSGPAEGSLNGPDVEFGFTTDGTTVECNVDGSGFVPCDSTSAEELSGLEDGSHTFLVRASDEAGNSTTSDLVTFNVDATAPEITEVTPVATPSTDTTPLVDLGLSEDAEIVYGGACVSSQTTLPAGTTAVTFEELAPGTYEDCTVSAIDEFGNEGKGIMLTAFTIEEPSSGGGGGGGRRNNNDEETTTPDEVVTDIGNVIANFFGGGANPGGDAPAGGEDAGEEGIGGGDEPTDLGAGPDATLEEGNTNLLAAVFSALGLDEVASWLLALIAALLAALGYGGWFAFRKWKKSNNA